MKPLLLLTMSSSGGKWLAEGIARHLPGCRYYNKEFFNPICNIKHAGVLQNNFGAELVGCYRNIALAGDQFVHDDIRTTWGAESYTFTKEVFSPFKLPVFMEHFRVFCMLRRTDDCLPPERLRVWSFYEHAWHALLDAGVPVRARTLQDRAREAHAIMRAHIIRSAQVNGVPVLYFDELMDASGDRLHVMLEHAVGYSSDDMVAGLIGRRFRKHP